VSRILISIKMAMKVTIQQLQDNLVLIKSVERQYCIDCIGRIQSLDLPFTNNLVAEKFSCKLTHIVDSINSDQIQVNLTNTSMKTVCAVDVILFDSSPRKSMALENDEWKVALVMEKRICNNCVFNRGTSGLTSRSKTQYHFPSHNVFIHLKPKSMEGQAIILNHIASLLENGALADIQFHINDTILPAHSLIISAASPVLAAMFFNNFQEKSTRIVTIIDASLEAFKQFLRYLYTGNILDGVKEVMAADLFVLADKYGVEPLKEECTVCLVEQLSVMNAVDTLIIAHLHSSTVLYQEAISFMSRNASAVYSSSRFLDFKMDFPDLYLEVDSMIKN